MSRPNEASILAALETASQPNYLGDTKCIDTLLRTWLSESLARWNSEPLDAERAKAADTDAVHRLAEVLLGRVEGYAPMLPWNSPGGGIDDWVAEQLGLPQTDPVERIEAALIGLLVRFHQAVDEGAQARAPMAETTKRIEEVIGFGTMLFLGIPADVIVTEGKAP